MTEEVVSQRIDCTCIPTSLAKLIAHFPPSKDRLRRTNKSAWRGVEELGGRPGAIISVAVVC